MTCDKRSDRLGKQCIYHHVSHEMTFQSHTKQTFPSTTLTTHVLLSEEGSKHNLNHPKNVMWVLLKQS
jgi:hypothetical protein